MRHKTEWKQPLFTQTKLSDRQVDLELYMGKINVFQGWNLKSEKAAKDSTDLVEK